MTTGSKRNDINNMDVLINDQIGIYSIKNNKIVDAKWNYPQSEEYKDIFKLKEFIKLIDKTNETEKFYEIEYK